MSGARRTVEGFVARFGRAPERLYFAPGRVNLIGDHTDYAGGLALPMAIERGTFLAVAGRADRSVVISSEHEPGAFTWESPGGDQGGEVSFSGYARGMLTQLPPPAGMDALVTSGLAVGAGLSSSAALCIVLGLALLDLRSDELDPLELARIAQRAENDFAGVQTGIMDQLAILMGRRRHALLVDASVPRAQPVRFDTERDGVSIVTVDSRVKRALVAGAYDERRAQAQAAAARLGVDRLGVLDADTLERRAGELPPGLLARARHIVSEDARVLAAVQAAAVRDWARVGRLFTASHRSLRDDYQVSHPTVDAIVELLSRSPGVLGARLTGAGFGGSVVALVSTRALAAVRATLADAGFTGVQVERASQGARRLRPGPQPPV